MLEGFKRQYLLPQTVGGELGQRSRWSDWLHASRLG